MFNREYSWMTHPLKGFTSTPIIQVRKKWIIVVDNWKVDKTKTFRDAKNEIDNFGIMTSFYSIRQLGCILSTFMHRRHLMVWNVFAPRLLFEIAEFLVFLIFCFLILSTNVSIISSLEKWWELQNRVTIIKHVKFFGSFNCETFAPKNILRFQL